MATRSETSLAALLLAQRLVESDATPLKASEYWAVLQAVGDPARLLGADATTVAALLGVDRQYGERVVRLLAAATALAFRLEELEQGGVRVVASTDADYPTVLTTRLGPGAPPLLHIAGDASLLSADLLAVVGSRHLAPEAAEVAKAAATAAVGHGLGVVSGGARGADRLAMTAALEAGGPVVAVPAEAMADVVRDPDVRRAVGDGALCVCTPYKPTAGFSVAHAMGRNRIVYGLSKAGLVVAAEQERGGTWAGAVEALKQRIAPVVAWLGDGAGPGNAGLVALGAVGIDRVDRLFPLPAHAPERAPPGRQLAMDV